MRNLNQSLDPSMEQFRDLPCSVNDSFENNNDNNNGNFNNKAQNNSNNDNKTDNDENVAKKITTTTTIKNKNNNSIKIKPVTTMITTASDNYWQLITFCHSPTLHFEQRPWSHSAVEAGLLVGSHWWSRPPTQSTLRVLVPFPQDFEH